MLYLLFGSENLVKLTLSGANYKDFEVVISFVNLQELEIQKNRGAESSSVETGAGLPSANEKQDMVP